MIDIVKVRSSIQYEATRCDRCQYSSAGPDQCLPKCPVNAISLDPLYINPDTCIDCLECVGACPNTVIEEQPFVATPKTAIVWEWTNNYKEYTHTYNIGDGSEPITKTFKLRQLKTTKGGTLQSSRFDSYAKPPTSLQNFRFYDETNEFSYEYQSAVFKWKHIATGILYDPTELDYSNFKREEYEYVEISPEGSRKILQPQVIGLRSFTQNSTCERGLKSKWFRYEKSPGELGPWVNEDANLTYINNSNLIGDSDCIAIFQNYYNANRYAATIILKDSSFLFVNKASSSSSYYLWDSSLSVGVSIIKNVKVLLVCVDVKNWFPLGVYDSYYFALASMGEKLIKRNRGSFNLGTFDGFKGKRSYIEEGYSMDRSNENILGCLSTSRSCILVDRPIKALRLSSTSSAFVTLSDDLMEADSSLGSLTTAARSKVIAVPIHGSTEKAPVDTSTQLSFYGRYNYTSPLYSTALFHTSVAALNYQYMMETSFGNPNSILSLAVGKTTERQLLVGSWGYLANPVLSNTPNKNFRFIDERLVGIPFYNTRRYGFNIGKMLKGLINSYKAKCLYKIVTSTYTPTNFNDTTYDNVEAKKAWEEASYIEITNTSKTIQTLDGVDITVNQIKALKDFETCGYKVKAGTLGGWINERVCVDTREKVWLDEKSYVLPSAYLGGGELLFLNTQITSTNIALEWEVLKVFCLARKLKLENTRIEEKASTVVKNLLACRYGGHTLSFISDVRLRNSSITFANDGDWGNVIIGFDNFFPHKVEKIYRPISLNGAEFSNCPNFFIKNSRFWIENKLYFKDKLIENVYNRNEKARIVVGSEPMWEA